MKREDNEALTQVGPGTVMGEMMRQYWHPVIRSDKLIADGPPEPIRLLGENYVAFRATDGRVGVIGPQCPHRCASMLLARNEENGLRCIFHGWKIDPDGKLVDVPNEARDRAEAFAAKVKVQHYPSREAAGMIWVFPRMDVEPPRFPDFEYTHLPPEQVDVRFAIVKCNWLQAMEGLLDSAHLGFLHASSGMARIRQMDALIPKPVGLEMEDAPYGLREAAIRETAKGRRNIRVREVVAPNHCVVPDSNEQGGGAFDGISTPLDDEWTAQIIVTYHPKRPLIETDLEIFWRYIGGDRDNVYADRIGPEGRWGQNREAMKQGNWSGAPEQPTPIEDFMVQESMGPVVDRTLENLCSTDAVIVAVRRKLLAAARGMADGGKPWGLEDPGAYDYAKIRGFEFNTDNPNLDWRTLDPHDLIKEVVEYKSLAGAAE